MLADFNGFTTVEVSQHYELPIPVQDVTSVRFLNLTNPSWTGYKEVEVISAPPAAPEACFARTSRSLPLTNYPAGDAREIGTLKSGDELYLGGVFTEDSGAEWARLGNNAWVKTDGLTLRQGCEIADLPKADPGPRFAAVTFHVTRPAACPGDTPPRTFTVEDASPMELADRVEKWRDLDC